MTNYLSYEDLETLLSAAVSVSGIEIEYEDLDLSEEENENTIQIQVQPSKAVYGSTGINTIAPYNV